MVSLSSSLATRGADGRTTIGKARAPLSSDGRIGDFYLDTSTGNGYGPKSSSGWGSATYMRGPDGWTPVYSVVTDSARRVLRVVDWTGGGGTKPATGKYVGASGYVDAIGDAVDIRGATGPTMAIEALVEAGDDATYTTIVPRGDGAGSNERTVLSRIFSPGGSIRFPDVASSAALTISHRVERLQFNTYAASSGRGAHTRRRALKSEIDALGWDSKLWHRTADRYMPGGAATTDSLQGGYWLVEIHGSAVSVEVCGSDGTEPNDTPAFVAALSTGLKIKAKKAEYRPHMVAVPDGGDLVMECRSGYTRFVGGPGPGVGGTDIHFFFTKASTLATVGCVRIRGATFAGGHVRDEFPYREYEGDHYDTFAAFQLSCDADADPENREIELIDCRFEGFPSFPWQIQHAKRVTISGGSCFKTKDPGLVACENVYVDNFMAEFSADNGISVSRGCSKLVMTNCTFKDCEIDSVWLSGYDVPDTAYNPLSPPTVTVTGAAYTALSEVSLVASSGMFYAAQKGVLLSVYDDEDQTGNQGVVKIVAIADTTHATGGVLDAIPAAIQGVAADSWAFAPHYGVLDFAISNILSLGCGGAGISMSLGAGDGIVDGVRLVQTGFVGDSEKATTGRIASGTDQLTVANASFFVAGTSHLRIEPEGSTQRAFLAKVTAKVGSVLTLDRVVPRTYYDETVRLVHEGAGYGIFARGGGGDMTESASSILIRDSTIEDSRTYGALLGNVGTLGSSGSISGVEIVGCLFSNPSGLGLAAGSRKAIALYEKAGYPSNDIKIEDNTFLDISTVGFMQAFVQDSLGRRWSINNNYTPFTQDALYLDVRDNSIGNAVITHLFPYTRRDDKGVTRGTAEKSPTAVTSTPTDIGGGVYVLTVISQAVQVAGGTIDRFEHVFGSAGRPRFVLRNSHATDQLIVKHNTSYVQGMITDLVIPPFHEEEFEFLNSGTVVWKGGSKPQPIQSVNTDASFTWTAGGTYSTNVLHTGTLTGVRTVTLDSTGAWNGLVVRFTRTGSGASALNIGVGPLKALATGTWCDVGYNGSVWVLLAYGAL